MPRGIASAVPAINEGTFGLLTAAAAIPGKNPVSDYLRMQAKAARWTKEIWADPTGGRLGEQVQGPSQSIGLMSPGIDRRWRLRYPSRGRCQSDPWHIVAGGLSSEKALDAPNSGTLEGYSHPANSLDVVLRLASGRDGAE